MFGKLELDKKRILLTTVVGFFIFFLAMGLFFGGSDRVNASDEFTKEKLIDKDYIKDIREVDKIREPLDDKYKSYYTDEKIVLIEDSKYSTELEMKLLTDYEINVPSGDDVKVASLNITNWKDGRTKLVDSISVYDKNNNYEKEPKDIWFKYKTTTTETRCYTPETNESNDTKELVKEISKEICNDYEVDNWIQFETIDELPSKGTEIGLFTQTIEGEEYEWIMNIDGFEILEWASWTTVDTESWTITSDNNYDIDEDYIVNMNALEYGIINGVWVVGSGAASTEINLSVYQNGDMLATIQGTYPFNQDGTNGGEWINLSLSDYDNNGRIISPNLDNGDFNIRVRRLSGTNLRVKNSDQSHSGSLFTATNQRPPAGHPASGDGIIVYEEYTCGNGSPTTDGRCGEYCKFGGYVKDENNNALVGANVTIWNQFNISESYENTTDSNGYWSYNITNSTNTYMAGAYYNNTLIGQLKPYISGTC